MARRLVAFWRNLTQRKRVERDLDDELRATFDMLVDEKVLSGMQPVDARRAARLQMGSQDALKDEIRDVRAGSGVDAFFQDLRFTFRLFRRSPGFTAIAILTLALGIGANAAIFGVVKSVLLDALPYADADRLLRVNGHFEGDSQGIALFRAAQVHAIAQRQRSFESLAAFDSARDAVYGIGDVPRVVRVAWVEPGLFKTLGVEAALGRTFREDDRAQGHVPVSGDERGPDTARATLLAHEAWRGLFSGDPAIVGREVRINGIPRTVIGVLPRGFVGLRGDADFYLAFDLAPSVASGAGWLGLVGRLKPGTTPEAAHRDLTTWASEYPQESGRMGLSAVPLRQAMVGATRTPLLVLLASAAFVLLIACANLAGALLSRGLARRKEFGVRRALGAGRGRLVRQLLTESAVLSLAGGAAGLLLAQSMLSLLSSLARPVLPAYTRLSIDPGVVVVTALVALGTGLAFGVVPALVIGRSGAQDTLHDGARGASEGRRPRRLRGVLVAAQLALCASLLAGAGLLARSLWEMARAPVGFDGKGVLSARFRLSTSDYPTLETRVRFHEQLLERLRSLPGVDAVAVANKVPTIESPRRESVTIEGATEAQLIVAYGSVSDDYFRTLRIPLLAGRTFDTSDRPDGPLTVVLSESLARRCAPAGEALRTRIRLGRQLATVIGIVADVRNDLARPDAEPMVYRSHRQESTQRFAVLLRTRGDPLALARPLGREVAALDRSLPVQQAATLETAVGAGLAPRQLPVMLTTGFGALALLLASVGVYAMFASMAAAREREFGVRLALGSRPREIAGLVLRQGAGWLAAGLLGGALGIVVVTRLVRGWLFGVPPFDPLALGGALALLLACAALALLIPVLRATRVDPVVALRAD